MKLDEIRGMADADLRARVTALEEERFRLRFRGATETLEDPLRQRTVRRDIARVLTVLREREAAAAASAPKAAKAAGAKGAKSAKSSPKASGQAARRGQTTAKTAAKAAR